MSNKCQNPKSKSAITRPFCHLTLGFDLAFEL
jgi:hypothetical protein